MKHLDIKHILIPVDFSETANLALDHAVHMAKLFKADITLLYVQETTVFTSAMDFSLMPVNVEFEKAVEKTATDQLQKMTDSIMKETGVKTTPKLVVDRIYNGVIDTAKEIDADIIVMGTHGVSGFQEFLLGSNAYRVASEAPCPVLTIQTHVNKLGFEKIVLPIDNSAASRQKVPAAVHIAKQYGATIHILELQTSSDADYVRHLNAKVKQVEAFIKQHNIPTVTAVLKGDNLATLAQSYATQVNADLIIIMSEQEAHLTGLFMGRYAQQVVNHSKIPVITIKPQEVSDEHVLSGFPLYPGYSGE